MNESTTIQYATGDATAPLGEGHKFIVHCCNDQGGWGRGFVLALSQRWPEPEEEYRKWFKIGNEKSNNPFALGSIQIVQVEEDVAVCNLIGQHGIDWVDRTPPVRYWAIRQGLRKLGEIVSGLRHAHEPFSLDSYVVAMPRMGCHLAGGMWEEMEAIINDTLIPRSIPVTVYDLPSK